MRHRATQPTKASPVVGPKLDDLAATLFEFVEKLLWTKRKRSCVDGALRLWLRDSRVEHRGKRCDQSLALNRTGPGLVESLQTGSLEYLCPRQTWAGHFLLPARCH